MRRVLGRAVRYKSDGVQAVREVSATRGHLNKKALDSAEFGVADDLLGKCRVFSLRTPARLENDLQRWAFPRLPLRTTLSIASRSMTVPPRNRCFAAVATLALTLLLPSPGHAALVVSYTEGSSWSTIYAQGFSPAVGSTPAMTLPAATPVELTNFQFFKSGNADTANDIRLAIIDGLFSDASSLADGMAPVLGVSTNVIGSTASLAVGDAISFDFDRLGLSYGGDYGAVFVTEGAGGALTPVLVSALTANYADDGSGTFRPESNYGTEDDFQYAVSNFIDSNAFGQFFNVFSFAADANFRAQLSVVPEPTTALLVLPLVGLLLSQRRCHTA